MSSGHTLKRNILIVDDEEMVLRCLQRMFSLVSSDWNVCAFNKSEDADQALKKTQFDVVIVDNNMPGIMGPSLIQRNRSLQADALFFILTGGDIDTMCPEVADGLLVKPCSLATIQQILEIAEIRHHAASCAA